MIRTSRKPRAVAFRSSAISFSMVARPEGRVHPNAYFKLADVLGELELDRLSLAEQRAQLFVRVDLRRLACLQFFLLVYFQIGATSVRGIGANRLSLPATGGSIGFINPRSACVRFSFCAFLAGALNGLLGCFFSGFLCHDFLADFFSSFLAFFFCHYFLFLGLGTATRFLTPTQRALSFVTDPSEPNEIQRKNSFPEGNWHVRTRFPPRRSERGVDAPNLYNKYARALRAQQLVCRFYAAAARSRSAIMPRCAPRASVFTVAQALVITETQTASAAREQP